MTFAVHYLLPRRRVALYPREDLELGMVSYTGNGVHPLLAFPDSFTRADVRLWDTLLTRDVGTPRERSTHPRSNPLSHLVSYLPLILIALKAHLYAAYYRFIIGNYREKSRAEYESQESSLFHDKIRNFLLRCSFKE